MFSDENWLMKKSGFTLIEVLFVTFLGAGLFLSLITLYIQISKSKVFIEAKESLLEGGYSTIEKIHQSMKNFSLDYEEYFNRKKIGCDQLDDGLRSVGENGYCDNFSAYGNRNSVNPEKKELHQHYFCSSKAGSQRSQSDEIIVFAPTVLEGGGCEVVSPYFDLPYQSFGQYALQFYDKKSDPDDDGKVSGDDDDTDVGRGPLAVMDATNVKEIYLISKDQQKRIFYRKKLIGYWNSGTYSVNLSGDGLPLFTLQKLLLRGFDLGSNHSIQNSIAGAYDGTIDTWVCDHEEGFDCHGDDLGSVYQGFTFPQDNNDGRVDVLPPDIVLLEWNIHLSPSTSPILSWANNDFQIHPFVHFSARFGLHPGVWYKRLGADVFGTMQFSLQSTFSINTIY